MPSDTESRLPELARLFISFYRSLMVLLIDCRRLQMFSYHADFHLMLLLFSAVDAAAIRAITTRRLHGCAPYWLMPRRCRFLSFDATSLQLIFASRLSISRHRFAFCRCRLLRRGHAYAATLRHDTLRFQRRH